MFLTSTPVSDTAFVNRTGELRSLATAVANLKKGAPSWLAILGPRKIGKTSLLLEAASRNEDDRVRFVVLDSFEEIPISRYIFLRYALRTLDSFFAAEIGASLEAAATRPADYRSLLQKSEIFARLTPTLRAFVLDLPERAIDARTMSECLELPEKLARALDVYVVIAWDEFQELGSLGKEKGLGDVFSLARSLWQKHKRTTYVASGSARAMLRSLVSSEHSPFFQHFTILELGPFSTEDAVELLRRGGEGSAEIPKALAERAAAVLGCHPFYLQLLGQTLQSGVEGGAPVNDATLKEALQDLLFSRTGRLALYFEALYQDLVGRSTYLASVLQAIAEGPRTVSEIAAAIGAPSGATVHYLERLGDAVQRDATREGYRLDDATFGLWLAWRKPGGTIIPMKVIGDEAELTCARELARMGFDLVYQSRSSHGAFDLLATRDRHPLGIQVKRSPPALAFSRAEWNRMVAEGKRFGWRWVVASVSKAGDVLFLDPAKARHGKTIRLGAAAAISNLLLWTTRRK